MTPDERYQAVKDEIGWNTTGADVVLALTLIGVVLLVLVVAA